jgi:signal transduction histidine kinase
VKTESPISRHLRARKHEIGQVWDQLVRAELPELNVLDHASLMDHLPEFLEGLAHWIEGDTASARTAFATLAEGHALQRLGYGIDVVTLTREYIVLRKTIMRELMAVPTSEATPELIIRLNEGMDEAIHEAVRRFTHRSEEIHDRFVGRLMAEAVERAGHNSAGVPIALRRANMGALWQIALDELRRQHPQRSVELKLHGNLVGVWDRDRVSQAVTTLLANVLAHGREPITVTIREADDHQALVTTVSYRGPELPIAQLYTMREIVLAHGAYWDVATKAGTTTLSLVWPRTPLEEVPVRT